VLTSCGAEIFATRVLGYQRFESRKYLGGTLCVNRHISHESSTINTSRYTISTYVTTLTEITVSSIALRSTRFDLHALFTRNINMCDILLSPLQSLRRNASCLFLAAPNLCRWSSAGSFSTGITTHNHYTNVPPRRPRIANVSLLLPRSLYLGITNAFAPSA